MFHNYRQKSALLILILFKMIPVPAAGTVSGALGSGITWTARHTALFLNPAGLVSGDGPMSLYGLYGFDTESTTGAFTGTSGSAGYGIGMIYNANTDKSFVGGIGFNQSNLALGFSASKTGSQDPSFDAGANFELSSLRLTAVLHNLSDISRADFGVGFMSGPLRLEVFYLAVWPLSGKTGTVGGGLVYNAQPLSVSLGVTKALINGSFQGDLSFHAGLDFAISNNLSIQGEYKPYLDASKYTAGLRYRF